MHELIEIVGKQVERIIYKNVPVVTMRQIDELHEKPRATKVAFNNHKEKLILGEDYFEVPYEEWKDLVVNQVYHQDGLVVNQVYDQNEENRGGHRGKMIFLTASGYLMITKPFTDDLAWQVQRQLVKRYFMAEKQVNYQDKYIALLEEHVMLLKKKTVKRRITEEERQRYLSCIARGLAIRRFPGRSTGRGQACLI